MSARPPSPGDDATPFLLRVCVKPAPFRPLQEFRSESRTARDEFKLYVWKTNTLREVAQMLHDADPSISTPLALHAFRHVHWVDRSGEFDATPLGVGITRVPFSSVSDLLSDVADPDRDDMDTDSAEKRQDRKQAIASTSALLGWDRLQDEIDESAAAITLAQLDLADGDFLDCVVKPDPTLALAPKPPKPIGRDRPPPADRINHSRR